MASFHLLTGNRLENLSAALAGVLRTPLPSPLQTEVFVVQSSGMARWVSMEIARHLGICANTRFYYPNEFVAENLGGVVSRGEGRTVFDPEVMTWRIMALLPDLPVGDGFEPLHRYIDGGDGELKSFQLASRIADLFDQYTLFRPEMIFDWEKGKEDHWQAVLWRSLARDARDLHRPALLKQFQERLRKGAVGVDRLPSRVSVFGISALPRFHVEMLATIARVSDVYLYVMNPCAEYWGDLPSDLEFKRGAARADAGNIPRELLHLEQGNRLLSGLGTLGRDFIEGIQSHEIESESSFTEPGEDSLLHAIQSDLLHLRAPAPEEPDNSRVIRADDRSVSLHACHSPMREVEVLRDHLLDWFEKEPDLEPGDILVMMPDIETYAPYIQTVMDTPEEEGRRIPYSIADRSLQAESQAIGVFLAILDLFKGRFGQGEVLAILESPLIRRRFDLAEKDVDLILKWCAETNIRWGIDGRHRAGFGLPDAADNTWQFGLERMLLGYAMAGGERNLFVGRLPYDPIEGDSALVLGKLAEFIRVLTAAARDASTPRPLSRWAAVLLELLDGLFLSDEDTEGEIQSIRDHLNRLEEVARSAEFHRPVGLDVIRDYLNEQFEKKGFGFGFITGGVTFCAMVPMRSIPFQVICLLGMDNSAYPRESRRIGFDLMARNPRPGDRSRRLDDQYLFLEALVSARRRLYISYVGQSIRDNSLAPPSVLVSDLMDYIDTGFRLPGGTSPLENLHTFHRLQAFSPAYFTTSPETEDRDPDRNLFSYSMENRDAANLLLSQRSAPRPFFTQALPESEEDHRSLELDDLCRFFSHPVRYFMERRLGILFGTGAAALEDHEPFEIKGLDRYSLDQRLLAVTLEGRSVAEEGAVVRASGVLPHAAVGDCLFETFFSDAEEFAQTIRPHLGDKVLPTVPVDLDLGGVRLFGALGGIYAGAMLRYRYARIRPGDILAAWIHHLVLNGVGASGFPRETILLGLGDESRSKSRPRQWRFLSLENSRDVLAEMLAIYREGMRRPLRFFPRTSQAYMESLHFRGKSREEALSQARNKWDGTEYAVGEGTDLHYRRCFGDADVLDGEFTAKAERILGPLLEHMTEIPCDEDI